MYVNFLRRFVEKDLFTEPDNVPDRHNLTYFPTVHDLQNHIHQAMADVSAGVLPMQHDDSVSQRTRDASLLMQSALGRTCTYASTYT